MPAFGSLGAILPVRGSRPIFGTGTCVCAAVTGIDQGLREIAVGLVQGPAIGHGNDSLSLFANTPQVLNEVVERVERAAARGAGRSSREPSTDRRRCSCGRSTTRTGPPADLVVPSQPFVPHSPDNMSSILPVRLVNVRPCADISGVITAIRSSPPISLFSASINGRLILKESSGATNLGSRNSTMTRARGSASARRISATSKAPAASFAVAGRRRARARTAQSSAATPSSSSSISLCRRSATGLSSDRRIHIDAHVVDFRGEGARCGRILGGQQRKTKNGKRKSPAVTLAKSTARAVRVTRVTLFVLRFSLFLTTVRG